MVSRFPEITRLEPVHALSPVEQGVPVLLFDAPIGIGGEGMKLQGLGVVLDIVIADGSHVEGARLLPLGM